MTDLKQYQEGIYLKNKKDSGWTVAHLFLEYVWPTSCQVAHQPGGHCWQPLSAHCVKHLMPVTAHCLVACWVGSSVRVVFCVFVTFPCGVLGQVWYLIVSIVSIPYLCILTYFNKNANSNNKCQ